MVKEMKVTKYLFIDEAGDVVSLSDTPKSAYKARTVCLKVEAEIPDDYFETPIFGVEIQIPYQRKGKNAGCVQDWLSNEAEELNELDEDKIKADIERDRKLDSAREALERLKKVDIEDVPF